jgi:sulfite exporter TauE/SafE
MNDSMLMTLGLGFTLGLRHATDGDHLAAVSTIVSERRSLWQSATVGTLWGVGHTASLLAAGFFVIVLGIVIPQPLANFLELIVAFMIIFLGTRLLAAVITGGRTTHTPSHSHNRRPLLVGIVHGLAGSAALTLLVLAQVVGRNSTIFGLAYLLIFGLGSIGGMLFMSCLIGLPFSLGTRFFQRTLVPLRLFAGAASTLFGIFYAWGVYQKF